MARPLLAPFVASALASLLLLVPAGTSAASASTSPLPPNFDATAMPGNEAENAVAINPTNPRNVVAMSTLPDVVAGIAVAVTFDGGRTWTRNVIGTGGGDLGDICCDEQ